MKKQITLFIFLNLLFFGLSHDLKQKNPEELFLSDQAIRSLKHYQNIFGEEELTIVSDIDDDGKRELQRITESRNGDFIDLARLLPNMAIIKLPRMEDEELSSFFAEAGQLAPQSHYAGMNFTNAHLAMMAKQIQHMLFPILFSALFLIILIYFKNLSVTLYLFFTSLIGATVGLLTTKLLYGHATILTTITPLVGFILTLANQFHVLFGMNYFQNKKAFFRHKLEPILIMMGTTIIGFSGLIFSDLTCIRQFGWSTTITLTITWFLNLLFLNQFEFVYPLKHIPIKKGLIAHSFHPKRATAILLTLILCGIIALKNMPTLVEAIFFFPKDHMVRVGHDQAVKGSGGAPQVDIVIERKDGANLSFEDIAAIESFESILKNDNIKILSTNELVLTLNEQYSHQKIIPKEKIAYYTLLGQIPAGLKDTLIQDQHYKISILTPPLEQKAREELIQSLRNKLQMMPNHFNTELNGLNYLLLNSQSNLVSTLVIGLLSSFFLIAVIFAFFNRNYKDVAIFSLISLASVLGGLFIMYCCGLTLNVSSVMTLSISIGLVDDNTIHLLYAKKHNESQDTIYKTCIMPMALSQILLIFSFCALAFWPFIPIRDFSLGLCFMLFMGMVLDLFVFPLFSKH